MVFDPISFNIDEVLLINPSANMFVFGDFNVHHKDWLTNSSGIDRHGKLSYNFSVSNDLTQIINFPTQITGFDSHSPAFLDLLLSSDTSICSSMAFPLLGNSDHVVVSVSVDFPKTQNRMPHFILWLMTILVLIGIVFVIICDVFHGIISLNSVLLWLVNFMIDFRLELMYISLILSIRSNLIRQQLVLLP